MAKNGATTDSKAGLIPTAIAAVALVTATLRSQRTTAEPAPDGEPASAGEFSLADTASVEEPEKGVKRLVWRFDRYQRERPVLSFPIAVGKKFASDKAGFLAALVAYFGFFSVFPLMLAFMSVLGFVLPDPEDQQEFASAAASQIPVVGGKIQDTAGTLEGSIVAIVIPVLIALWSGLKIIDAMQNALNDVWDLPPTRRPKMLRKRLRGVLMLGLIGGGLVASVAASNVAALIDAIPGIGKVAIWAAALGVSIVLYLLAFQLLTDVTMPWRDIFPGAVFGGVAWWALQTFGSALIIRQQESAGDTYGDFATIIALLVFLFIAAQLSILGAEISAVKARRLYPRSIVKGDFTRADIEAYELLADSTRQDEAYQVQLVLAPAQRD